MVLPGPSGAALGLRYWRVSRMNTSRSRPQRNFRYRRVGASSGGTIGQYSRNARRPGGMYGSVGPAKAVLTSGAAPIPETDGARENSRTPGATRLVPRRGRD